VVYMYLDTATPPKVTVGIGNMLPSVAAAQALPFINTATKAPATAAEIEHAFKKVAAMDGGQPSFEYKQKPSIEITEDTAQNLALNRVTNEFIPLLRRHFAGFDGYPLPARRALVDMIYNMGWSSKDGHHGLITFGALKRAAEAGDWKNAALHCHRKDTRPKKKSGKPTHAALRNAWTQRMFEQADEIAAFDR
jgi:GH24 family phage-related lysozyme (muramidase)